MARASIALCLLCFAIFVRTGAVPDATIFSGPNPEGLVDGSEEVVAANSVGEGFAAPFAEAAAAAPHPAESLGSSSEAVAANLVLAASDVPATAAAATGSDVPAAAAIVAPLQPSRRARSSARRGPRSGVQAQIAHLQGTTNLCIPSLAFFRLVREMLNESYPGHSYRFESRAMQLLQQVCEDYCVERFVRGILAAQHRRVSTVAPQDTNLQSHLSGVTGQAFHSPSEQVRSRSRSRQRQS